MPAAGDLDKKVVIQAEERVPNGQGGFTTGWANVRPAWAKIIGLSGDEAISAGVERSVQQWRVTMYARDDVTTKNRLQWGARLLAIKAVLPDPKDTAGMILICESGAEF